VILDIIFINAKDNRIETYEKLPSAAVLARWVLASQRFCVLKLLLNVICDCIAIKAANY